MNEKNKIIKLASNCFFVKGANKNLLIDLQNDAWYHIDFELDQNSEIDISTLKKDDVDYLVNKQILIQIPTELKDNFPRVPTTFEVSSIIEFAIIDRNAQSTYSVKKALIWLDSLLLKFCQIRFYSDVTISEVEEILETVKESNLESLDLLLPFSNDLLTFFEQKLELHPKLHAIIFHSSDRNQNELSIYEKRRLLMKEPIVSSNSCGIVHPGYFSNTKKHILKSMNYNSCLYKKIGIDVDGKIKNCPSMQTQIGSMTDIDKIDLSDLETEFWNIKKDEIEICKECEFRYICFDCRVKVSHKYARPNTCIYNPYTSLWKGQKGYENPELHHKQ